MDELFIGRQPIFNRRQQVEAYELLYRSTGLKNTADIVDGDMATVQVVLDSISQIGLDALVGRDKKAYINTTRNFLIRLKESPKLLPPERVVIEILENISIDQELIDAIRVLKRAGHTIALDDVNDLRKVNPILSLANIIKIDLMGWHLQGVSEMERMILLERQLRGVVSSLRGLPVYLLAEKVETQAEYALCQRLGFHMFQGYFLCKPSIVKSRKLDASRLVILRTISYLQDPNASAKQLEAIISQDVVMVNKLLRVINSSYYSLPTTIKSISQAIAMLGTRQLQAWMTLMLMGKIEKPPELTTIGLQRAKMCEGFARAKGLPHVDTHFLVGLLSILDALMDTTMEELISNIPVSKEVVDALLTHRGDFGQMLQIVMAYERGDWGSVSNLKLSSETIRRVYLDAIDASSRTSKEMHFATATAY